MFILPVIMIIAIANIARQVTKRKYLFAFLSSAVVISVLLIIVSLELYPTIIYSPVNPENSLTVYNSASSSKTLGIMLTVAAIGVPLVAAYTTFVFWTFKGKVKLDETSY
jgi:cytochrome d ubiquinol oxidase subunit II